MALFAMAVPILPDKTDAWRRFADEIAGGRNEEWVASRRALGVRERVFLQHTPTGDLAIVTLEGDDPVAALAAFGQASDEFGRWFKVRVQEVHGYDLAAPPPGPLPELVVDSGSR